MSQGSESTLGILNTTRFHIARLSERLWLKPLISCVLSLAVAFGASLADQFVSAEFFPDISAESIESLLEIIAASMLVIAVFAVGAMLSAYASASNSATPRCFPLVVGDDVSQNALSTFIGAFIFSIVALSAILNGFYGAAGRFVLFVVMFLVFALVILSFVRWVDRIARLGRMGNTIEKVEAATDAALQVQAQFPTLGAVSTGIVGQGTAVYPKTVGYIQYIDIAKLQRLAEQVDCTICLCALPGSFVAPGSPLAYIENNAVTGKECAPELIIEAFVIASQRTFKLDPCFGLNVLSEIASRALSPAVNDAGTALDIIGTLVRLFVRWAQTREKHDNCPVKYDRVAIMAISINDMFDDAFNAIARDGASNIEVAIRLQQAFHSLTLLNDDEMRQTAISHAKLAFSYAERSLTLPEEREALKSVAERNFQSKDVPAQAPARPGRS
jgi:uncharacterized membrane protein